MTSKKSKKLNLGCGSNKIKDCINVDINKDFEPEMVFDFRKFPYPLEDKSVSHIYFFHVIEHIPKIEHPTILIEFYRIISDDGCLIISYPEFSKIAQNWVDNKEGKRTFWEATIYGRQTTEYDYHVSAMETLEFKQLLQEVGFDIKEVKPEKNQEFNTLVICSKGTRGMTREEGVKKEIWG